MEDKEEFQQLFDNSMRLWEYYGRISNKMDTGFGKFILTVAGGSFGLSFSLVNLIVPVNAAVFLCLLIAAWSCFAAALVSYAVSSLVSSKVFSLKQKETADEMNSLAFKVKPEFNTMKDFVTFWNYASLFSYIGGIICFLVFITLNLL